MPSDALTQAGPIAVAAGWIGQACFFSRFLVQWLASERARRSVVPRSFWWLSLAGALLLSAYSIRRGGFMLLLGFVVSVLISATTLILERRGARAAIGRRWALVPALFFVIMLAAELYSGRHSEDESLLWLCIVGVGQAFWVARFPVQWWLSARAGVSHFPAAFWWLSLAGNLLLLTYALHLGDPIYVLGFLPGPLLQVRNLMLGRGVASAS